MKDGGRIAYEESLAGKAWKKIKTKHRFKAEKGHKTIEAKHKREERLLEDFDLQPPPWPPLKVIKVMHKTVLIRRRTKCQAELDAAATALVSLNMGAIPEGGWDDSEAMRASRKSHEFNNAKKKIEESSLQSESTCSSNDEKDPVCSRCNKKGGNGDSDEKHVVPEENKSRIYLMRILIWQCPCGLNWQWWRHQDGSNGCIEDDDWLTQTQSSWPCKDKELWRRQFLLQSKLSRSLETNAFVLEMLLRKQRQKQQLEQRLDHWPKQNEGKSLQMGWASNQWAWERKLQFSAEGLQAWQLTSFS